MEENKQELKCHDNLDIINQIKENPNRVVLSRPGLNLDHFLSTLNECPLPDYQRSILGDLFEARNEGNKLLKKAYHIMMKFNPKTFEELIWIYKCVCAAFLLKEDYLNVIHRYYLLQRTFLLNASEWELCPVHIHVISETLWKIMGDSRDVLYFARKINSISLIAFNISACLVWASVLHQLQREVKMFRFYEFSKLISMLEELDVQSLQADLNSTYTLLQLVSFLQNIIIMRKSSEQIKKRFECFFTYEPEDLDRYKNWCGLISRAFDVNPNKESEIGDYSLLYELVKVDMLDSLEHISYKNEDNSDINEDESSGK